MHTYKIVIYWISKMWFEICNSTELHGDTNLFKYIHMQISTQLTIKNDTIKHELYTYCGDLNFFRFDFGLVECDDDVKTSSCFDLPLDFVFLNFGNMLIVRPFSLAV